MKQARSASGPYSAVPIEALARDCDQLWAEAKFRFSSGEKWWLDTAALVAIAAKEQATRYQGDPWEEIVAPWLEVRSSTSVSEVLEKRVNKPQAQWTQADQEQRWPLFASFGLGALLGT